MAQIKKISKEASSSQNDSDNDYENDDSKEDENNEGIATFTAGNVEKEVSKGKSIQRQLQIWDNLLELRIAMQKSLTKINQFPVQMKPFKEAISTEENELKQSQVMLAKILDQLLELKKQMLEKNKVVDVNEEPLSKKRKLNDYDQHLTEGFESLKSWRNETIEDWNDRTRIVGKTGFSAFETSVTRQIEHILADKSRLVKRTKLKRSAYEII